MAGKDPAVLFYTSDFLAGASLMTMKERGQYITLLCLQRERGHMTAAEMQRAVGKLSDEVRSKFVEDGDGKLYNERMEQEIEKRKAHSQRQRENVLKRWNKPNGNGGTFDGNTTVLPLGNGNGNNTVERRESLNFSGEVPTTPQSPPSPVAGVVADYLDRINASASPVCLDELRGFAEELGPEVCKRAFDIALDCKKTTWPYIRAILRDKVARGVKCLADWDALEQTYQAKRQGEKPGHKVPYGSAGQDAPDELERDALDRLLKGGA